MNTKLLATITVTALLLLLGVNFYLKKKVLPQAKLPFMEYCQYFNYPVENHTITTEDGYRLGYFRIQAKNTQIKKNLPPVFLHHGLLDCSDTWIINDEARAPAFILANNGYDVWLGNSRGNKHSRNHVSLSPSKDPFWQFSWQNMSRYDLPAAFQYISDYTGFEKIDYVGHSQGTIIMFSALSQNDPIINAHLKHFIALGPVTTVINQTSSFMVWLANSKAFWSFLDKFDVQEVITQNWMTTELGSEFCAIAPNECVMLLGPIADADPKLDNSDRMEVMAGHDPAGTSKMNGLHWKQALLYGRYSKFDYGDDQLNIQHYGQVIPPEYDLSNIKVPVYLFSGSSDRLADPTDVERLKSQLVNSPQVWSQEYNAGHCTFLWGRDMSHMNDILDILDNKI